VNSASRHASAESTRHQRDTVAAASRSATHPAAPRPRGRASRRSPRCSQTHRSRRSPARHGCDRQSAALRADRRGSETHWHAQTLSPPRGRAPADQPGQRRVAPDRPTASPRAAADRGHQAVAPRSFAAQTASPHRGQVPPTGRDRLVRRPRPGLVPAASGRGCSNAPARRAFPRPFQPPDRYRFAVIAVRAPAGRARGDFCTTAQRHRRAAPGRRSGLRLSLAAPAADRPSATTVAPAPDSLRQRRDGSWRRPSRTYRSAASPRPFGEPVRAQSTPPTARRVRRSSVAPHVRRQRLSAASNDSPARHRPYERRYGRVQRRSPAPTACSGWVQSWPMCRDRRSYVRRVGTLTPRPARDRLPLSTKLPQRQRR